MKLLRLLPFTLLLFLLAACVDPPTTQNQPPVADIKVSPPSGTGAALLEVTLDASASTDPDGTIASYEWHVNGNPLGGSVELQTFLAAGEHTISLRVTDNRGASHEVTIPYVVLEQGDGAADTIRFKEAKDGDTYIGAEGLDEEIMEYHNRVIWIEADEPWKLTVESYPYDAEDNWLEVSPDAGEAGLTPVTLTVAAEHLERAPYTAAFIHAWPADAEPSDLHDKFIPLLANVPYMAPPSITELERLLPTGLVAYSDLEIVNPDMHELRVELEPSDDWIRVSEPATILSNFGHNVFLIAAECGPEEETRVGSVTVRSNQPFAAPVIPVELECGAPPASDFNLVPIYAPGNEFTEGQKKIIEDAMRRWESVITGDLEDVVLTEPRECLGVELPMEIDDHVIVVNSFYAPESNVLGSASVCEERSGGPDAGLPYASYIELNLAHLEEMINEGKVFATSVHEIGHSLGIGTRWSASHFGLLAPQCDSGADSVIFTGPTAISQYQHILSKQDNPYDDEDLHVQAKTGGYPDCGHWDYRYKDEVMSRVVTGSHQPLSAFTIGSLADLGYEVSYEFADDFELSPVETFSAQGASEVLYFDSPVPHRH